MIKVVLVINFLAFITFQGYAADKLNQQDNNDSTDTFYQEEPLITTAPQLTDKGGKVYLNGKRIQDDKVIQMFDYNANIKAAYKKGDHLRKTGITLITLGAITTGGGIALMVSGFDMDAENIENAYQPQYFIGMMVGSLGELMIGGGIVCSIIGKNKVRYAVSEHNKLQLTHLSKPSKTIEVGFIANGIGVRLNF